MDDIIISAPGKVILHGEHAVVYGKRALAASLNLRTFLRLRPWKESAVKVFLPDIDIERKWQLEDIQEHLKLPLCNVDDPQPATEDQLQKLKEFAGTPLDTTDTKQLAIIAFLYLYCSICQKDGSLCNISVQLSSSLPPGAGLGSSAAYSTCLAAALLLHTNRIRKPDPSAGLQAAQWDQNNMELINRWAFLAEKVIHGNPSGVDNSVSTFGGALEFQNGKVTQINRVPTLRILLLNTCIPRSTKVLVAGVRAKYDQYPSIMSSVLDCIEAITQKCLSIFEEVMDTPSLQQYKVLNDLVDMNQHQLCVLGVGHPALDAVVSHCASRGLHTKLTGAGGGGCAFALIPPDTDTSVIVQVSEEVVQLGYKCWETVVGGKGVLLHLGLNDNQFVPPQSFTDIIANNVI